MFVVRRPFKSYGKHYTYGDVINNPSDIKLFKSKFAEGKILEVTESNYDNMAEYFKSKFNVELPPLKQEAEEAEEAEEVVNQNDNEDTDNKDIDNEKKDEEPKVNTAKASVVVAAK